MKLISVTLHGYKRFEQKSSMKVDGKLIAIVGPNESGKSSFLQALMHFNHNEPLTSSGGTRETTRNVNVPPKQSVVEATYLVEENDREALSEEHGGQDIRWCKVSKKPDDGTHYYSLTPSPKRSLRPREKAVRTLKGVLERQGFLRVDQEHEDVDLADEVGKLASALETKDVTLSEETSEQIQTVAATLDDALPNESLKYLLDLKQQLHYLTKHETGNPESQAIDILSERRPEFLPFSEEERFLQSEYNLDEVWEDPPPALGNLAQLADLDLEDLRNAVSEGDSATVAAIEEPANEQLRSKFEAWSQSSVAIELRVEGQILKVLVREPNSRFTNIAERSDGLRQFVALLAFTNSKPSEKERILLIDEAETHLHYNAQADLIQTLTRQDIVAKVIYTTHSIGCLPEDLGMGVRLIESNEPESYTSRIENSFWISQRPGFSPLLFGMGASTLAFVPLRNAVIAEGASDIILWPTLFREATGHEYLDFQIAPGLSEASSPKIIVLDNEAPQTTYLLDADVGGNNLRSELKQAGIPASRIFQIPDKERQGLVVEDLIRLEVYVQAVNEELHRSYGSGYSLPADRLPAVNRPAEVETWCEENGVKPPNKTAVAYRVLEKGSGELVLAEHYYEPVKQIFADISAVLQDSTS